MRRDLIALPDNSKVWVYQAPAPVSYDTSEQIKADLYEFTMNWSSHGVELDCYGNLFHYQFLVMVADPSNLPSGCSIDASVHFIKELGAKYGVDFMDRLTFAYMKDDEVYTVHSNDLAEAMTSGRIDKDTLMFNNLVTDKETFLENWIIPLEDSWHKKFL